MPRSRSIRGSPAWPAQSGAARSRWREAGPPRRSSGVIPTANFLGHYSLPGLAERGFAGIGLTTRYVGNDTNLIMENCLLDMGSMVAHLRDRGYEKVVLVGNSGGASIVPYYQAQAVTPTVASPPGGGPDLTGARLIPADGIAMFNAHPSRARLCTEWLDPAIVDEHQPFERDAGAGHVRPPQRPSVSALSSSSATERLRRPATGASRPGRKGMLHTVGSSTHFPNGLDDLVFTVQGTTADLRFLDGSIDPSDREIGVSLWGPPSIANYLPAGIGRCSSLRSWINQWSIDHTLGDSLRWLPEINQPVWVGAGTADPVVVPLMAQQMHDAATGSTARELKFFPGGTHYFEGQPDILGKALDALADWAAQI